VSDAVFIGIDPGVHGALVCIDSQALVLDWADAPTLEVPGPKRASKRKGHEGQMVATIRQRYDKAAMARILWGWAGKWTIRRVVIEEVQPMPRRTFKKVAGSQEVEATGRGSNPFTDFGLGHGRGLWEGICAALELRVELVPPATWKAQLVPRIAFAPDLKPTQRRSLIKEAARARALELFPAFAEHLARKMDDGRAEGALLAEVARRLG
jgi:hypothetical protein